MRTKYVLLALLTMALPVMGQPDRAEAITDQQFRNMCSASESEYGLRSGSGPTDVSGAGFGMDDGAGPRDCVLGNVPPNWDNHLQGTIEFIKNYPGSDNNYLLIVKGCPGLAERYASGSTFPKCNRVSGAAQANIGPLSNHSVQDLVNWVNNWINNNL